MNVTIAEPLEIALRNSSEDNRRRVGAWIDSLKRWDTDPYIKEHSKKLEGDDNIYMLITSSDIRLFFAVEKDEITVLEAAKRSTILRSKLNSGATER